MNQIKSHKIIQLKNNFISKGLVPLEKIFDHNDISIRPIFHPITKNLEEHNLDIETNPQKVKLAKYLEPSCKETLCRVVSTI